MKTVTVEQALTLGWCYPEEKIRAIAGDKTEWTALDVLRLTNVSAKVRLNAVLRPEFLEDEIMHEIACQYAEDALTCVKDPDPSSVTGVETKRLWMRGEATDAELDAAYSAANTAANAAADAACASAWYASYAAASAANAAASAANAAWDAVDAAACAAAYAATNAVCSATWNEARDAAYERQVEMLIKLLEESV
jgi:hypothetical protein